MTGWKEESQNRKISLFLSVHSYVTTAFSAHFFFTRYMEDRKAHEGQKWKLPPLGQPISLFSAGNDTTRTIIMPQDDSKLGPTTFYSTQLSRWNRVIHQKFSSSEKSYPLTGFNKTDEMFPGKIYFFTFRDQYGKLLGWNSHEKFITICQNVLSKLILTSTSMFVYHQLFRNPFLNHTIICYTSTKLPLNLQFVTVYKHLRWL